jgi:hypothetical protein
VQGLLWRRAAAPYRVERWRLVRDFRPALAGQIPDFRAPVREGDGLEADELFLKCSCHLFPFVGVPIALQSRAACDTQGIIHCLEYVITLGII